MSGDKAVTEGDETVLRRALAECRRHLVYVVIFSFALNLLYLAPSIFMLQVYDRVLTSGDMLTLVFLFIVLVASVGALSFLDATRMRLLAAMSRRLDRLLAPHLLRASLERNTRAVAGQVQILREFDNLRTAASGPAAVALIDTPWTPVYLIVCFIISPWLGFLTVGGGMVLVGMAYINQRAANAALKGSLQASGTMYNLQAADGAHAETVRALGMRDGVVRRQLKARETMTRAQLDSSRSSSTYSATTKFIRLVMQSAALGLGVVLALRNDISSGAIIAASILTTRAFAPIEMIVGSWNQIEQGRQSLIVLRKVLRAEDTDIERTTLPVPTGGLALENVAIRAPNSNRAVVMGANFKVSPGEIVGVVGPSGAGKSTLMRAIAGAIPVDQGAVRLDSAKLTDWDSQQLGRHIAYLPQDIGLLPGTVADNIGRFDRQAGDSDRDIVQAAQAVGAHEMILSLPNGYDTEIGAGGRGLSVGQAQRVSLARAFFRDPQLIVLDEPNAHLDADGETTLINALKNARDRGAVVLVVAHRTNFMHVVDKLLFMRDGRIELFGPRDQVVAKLASGAAPRPAIVATAGEAVDGRT